MSISQLISGLVLVLGGIVLVLIAIFAGFKGGSFIAFIWAIPLLLVGVFILFNKREDEIEQVKNERRKK